MVVVVALTGTVISFPYCCCMSGHSHIFCAVVEGAMYRLTKVLGGVMT